MAQAAQLLNTQSPITQSSTPFLAHIVKPTETLSKIIANHYGAAYGSPQYQKALTLLQYSNPEIKDINKIYPGQIIRLLDLTPGELAYCPKPTLIDDVNREEVTEAEVNAWLDSNSLTLPNLSGLEHHWPKSPQEQDAFRTLAWLEHNYGVISTSAAAGLNTFGGVVSRGNQSFMAEVKSLWQQYQSGKITQNQYNYRRQLALKKFAHTIGPFEKLVFKGKTAREAVRISRAKDIPATAKIDRQLHRLSRMSQMTKYGGIALTATGAAVACHQIGNTDDRHKKNEIFVETVSSTVAGTAGSMVLGVVLFSNPVGWGVALVAGTALAVGSYATGKGMAKVYDRYFNQYDLVDSLQVDKLCR